MAIILVRHERDILMKQQCMYCKRFLINKGRNLTYDFIRGGVEQPWSISSTEFRANWSLQTLYEFFEDDVVLAVILFEQPECN
jgi:hypothetical protein